MSGDGDFVDLVISWSAGCRSGPHFLVPGEDGLRRFSGDLVEELRSRSRSRLVEGLRSRSLLLRIRRCLAEPDRDRDRRPPEPHFVLGEGDLELRSRSGLVEELRSRSRPRS